MNNSNLISTSLHETEEWRDIPGYEGYYKVSNKGRIYSIPRIGANGHKYGGSLCAITSRYQTYLGACLCKDGKQRTYSVHRLVAIAFIPNPENLPIVNHKDENPMNNNVENLEWCDQKYNAGYGTAIARRVIKQRIPIYQMTANGEIVKRFESMTRASLELGISMSVLTCACQGRNMLAAGYRWRYADDRLHQKYVDIRKERELKYNSYLNSEHCSLKICVSQYTVKGEYIATYPSIKKASEATNIPNQRISEVCRGVRETAGGYVWRRD